MTGNLQLADLVDNGNQTGIHGSHEALYVNFLAGGGTLDLNHLWLYVYNDGKPFALPDGLYNGVMVSNSPIRRGAHPRQCPASGLRAGGRGPAEVPPPEKKS